MGNFLLQNMRNGGIISKVRLSLNGLTNSTDIVGRHIFEWEG